MVGGWVGGAGGGLGVGGRGLRGTDMMGGGRGKKTKNTNKPSTIFFLFGSDHNKKKMNNNRGQNKVPYPGRKMNQKPTKKN